MKNIKPCPKINARWNKTLSTVQKQKKKNTTKYLESKYLLGAQLFIKNNGREYKSLFM